MCRPASLCVRLLLPQGAASPGHGQDPPPRWAGMRLSRALVLCRCPRCSWLARARVAVSLRPGASRTLQRHRGAPVLPRPILPGLDRGVRGGWVPQGARGHAAPVLCRSRRASLAPRGPALPPRSIGGAAGIAARRRAPGNRGHMLLFHAAETTPAQLPAQPQAGGRGAHRPGAPRDVPTSPLPPARLGLSLPATGTHGWPELRGPTGQHSRSPTPCRDESSFPAPPGARTQPGAGTRRRHPPPARSAHGRGAGVGGSLMDIHEQRVC